MTSTSSPAPDQPGPAVADLTSADPTSTDRASPDPTSADRASTGLASTEPGPTATSQTEGVPAAPSQADCAGRLRALFPALFGSAPKPLKLRIQADIQARAPGVFTKPVLSAFLHRYTGSTAYLVALTQAEHRYDLDGGASGEPSAEHRAAAEAELQRRRANHEARRALLNEQRRNRANLLRDFEATTLERADFCTLKEVAPDALDGLLAIARREAEERARRAPAIDRQRRPQQTLPGRRPNDPAVDRAGDPARDRPRGETRDRSRDPQHDRPRDRPHAKSRREDGARVPAATSAATPVPAPTGVARLAAGRNARPAAARSAAHSPTRSDGHSAAPLAALSATRRPTANATFTSRPAAPPTAMQAALEAALRGASSIAAVVQAAPQRRAGTAPIDRNPTASHAVPTAKGAADAAALAAPDAPSTPAAPDAPGAERGHDSAAAA